MQTHAGILNALCGSRFRKKKSAADTNDNTNNRGVPHKNEKDIPESFPKDFFHILEIVLILRSTKIKAASRTAAKPFGKLWQPAGIPSLPVVLFYVR
jgi:hypothetical protein